MSRSDCPNNNHDFLKTNKNNAIEKQIIMNKFYFILILLFAILSCKKHELNYIIYYQKVNEIDSIQRYANNEQLALEEYKKLFKEYEPKNGEKTEEYSRYLTLSDHYDKKNINKKSLKKLIYLLAPGAKHGWHKQYYPLFTKYGIDSLQVKQEIIDWKKKLNHTLIDSFSIAIDRDQGSRRGNYSNNFVKLMDKKNIELFKWTFENYGFPSLQKIGLTGKNGRDIHMRTFFIHYIDSKDYEFLKKKSFEYVKSGDFDPYTYAAFVDRHEGVIKGKPSIYGVYTLVEENSLDTVQVNKNRKSIGLASIDHRNKIVSDFHKSNYKRRNKNAYNNDK